MRFLSNIFDPTHPHAKMTITRHFDQSPAEAWAQQERWLAGKLIAEPKATAAYTTQQLKDMEMVGVYDPERDEDAS